MILRLYPLIRTTVVVMIKMHKKLQDPENYTLPIQIGESDVVQSLSDLGENINLMPLFIFKRLGSGNPRPTQL